MSVVKYKGLVSLDTNFLGHLHENGEQSLSGVRLKSLKGILVVGRELSQDIAVLLEERGGLQLG